MQNRKDLLQAHRLMTQRAALALMQGEPDPPDRPLRRLNMGTFSSILVAVMVAAVFGIWGVIAPGGAQGLDSPGTLIIDSQSATSYIWCESGKLLCPVVNYASARLALATSAPNQRTVSQTSLSTYPRGPEIGIAGLPPLPAPDMLTGQPWSVCVQAKLNPATQQQHTVTTLAGGRGVGGQPIGGQGLVVQASGSDWVIWGGQRMLIPATIQAYVLVALGTSQQQAETVPLAWLNAFPQGADFAPPDTGNFGRPVTGPGGGTVPIGQVFTTGNLAGTTPQYYVMLAGGLASITQTQARLLETAPNAKLPRTINPSLVPSHQSPVRIPPGGLPQRMPAIRAYTAAMPLCVVYSGSASTAPGVPQVTVGGTVPSGGLPIAGAGGLNQLALPPGKAALVGVVSGSQAAASAAGQAPQVASYFLVTGGLRYGLASPAVASYLGYTLQQRTLLPAGVVDLLPQGPALDPSQARDRVTNQAG